ncbi:hypothetical protein BLNAU_20151 [Blattamonas nauphoetae]|uniref:Right handed beta helix domain-containing protein n=1 Tax=Blattamonas nauphoetae TaxID=2049346 RepID=A0ABQ9X016_9EUKA|nr:hypothetical protein BLNAU_20151 [Blattamonas nauphoetae]
MPIVNMSSLPGEVKQASSLFSQRMIGCGIWGSNNHLSGSLLRDLNGGGSFLCSNSTFDWCHTTSSERPSLSSNPSPIIDSHSFPTTHSISSQPTRGNADTEYSDQTFDRVERLSFTQVSVAFTNCKFTNMYSFTGYGQTAPGGSAIFIWSYYVPSPTALSLVSCSFSKCSVTHRDNLYGGCVYLYNLSATTNTIDGCSFDDWYSGNDSNSGQYGGGIGTFRTTAPLVITNSNFTLSGATTNKYNGGFADHQHKFLHLFPPFEFRFVVRVHTDRVLKHFDSDCIDKEAVTHLSEAELVSGDDSKEQTILVLRVLHLLRDNNFQFVTPCLITWESIFRYALRLDVTDFSNHLVKLNLRFGDICPLIKKAYEQDTSPIDDSPPPPLAPLFEDMESEDGHFDNSKIEQSVKTAMGNADVGAYTSLSSHSPAIQSGIFFTPNAGHLIKPENVIIKEKNLVKVVICGGHPVKQPHPMSHILENFGTGTEFSVHYRRLSEGFKRCGARIKKICIQSSSGDLEMPRRHLLSKKTPPIWPLHTLSCNRRLSAIWSFFEVEDETGSVILL